MDNDLYCHLSNQQHRDSFGSRGPCWMWWTCPI